MKPILFNTEGVKAILDERKTVTRRALAYRGLLDKQHALDREPYKCGTGEWCFDMQTAVDDYKTYFLNPPCQPGGILYVRETWAYGYVDTTDFECRCNECFFEELKAGTKKDSFLMPRYFYRTENLDGLNIRWRPSIHMPKEAARLFLRVTGVRVERLQDITYEECKAEGFDGVIFEDDTEGLPAIAINRFSRMWDSTIKKKNIGLFDWEANPWVWVIEFERISREEASEVATGG